MSEEGAISVSEAVRSVNRAVAAMPTLVVRGEVTGFHGPHARTGHCYFSVKDEGSAMDAIVWKGIYDACGFTLRDGLEILITGKFDVYQPTGKLSFKATSIELAGEGLLRQRVAELARKLEREGLMDDARKRKIPVFCTRVCVVTSLSGYVIDDAKRTLARRNPLVAVDVVGCAVEGPSAPASIIRALKVAGESKADAILLIRGGGTYEQLMCFNDEGVARAIAACPVPVITGIGHEPDVTIADMVADRRQSTPTAAAESVAPTFNEVSRQTNVRRHRMANAMASMLRTHESELAHLTSRVHSSADKTVTALSLKVEGLGARRCLNDPSFVIDSRRSTLMQTEQRLHDAIPKSLRVRREKLSDLSARLVRTAPRIVSQHSADDVARRLMRVGGRLLVPYQTFVAKEAATLDALSPLKVLSRGYSLTRDEGGHVITSASQVGVGSRVSVTLAEGSVSARVESTDMPAHAHMQ